MKGIGNPAGAAQAGVERRKFAIMLSAVAIPDLQFAKPALVAVFGRQPQLRNDREPVFNAFA